MGLTQRQHDFLRKLLDLYHDANQPIHYSQVGEALGVNRFSAYDMLKLLEQKGYLRSQYVLAPARSGPGRSSIAFLPTPKARAAIRFFGGRDDGDEWASVREAMLARLRNHRLADDELLKQLMAHIPETRTPLEFCTEAAAALALNLHAIRQRAADLNPLRALSALAPSGGVDLGALAGLSLGSALARGLDRAALDGLLSMTKRFQAQLSTLSDDHLRNISDFVEEALETLAQSQTPIVDAR